MSPFAWLHRRWLDPSGILAEFKRHDNAGTVNWLVCPAIPGSVTKDEWWWRSKMRRVILEAQTTLPFYLVYRTESGEMRRSYRKKRGLVALGVGDQSVQFAAFTWHDRINPREIEPVTLIQVSEPVSLAEISKSVIIA